MKLSEYQKLALKTADYAETSRVLYPLAGLVSEVGEVADIVKRALHQDKQLDIVSATHLADELGDVLWYVTVLACDLGWDLEAVARGNIQKLANRYKDKGNGSAGK